MYPAGHRSDHPRAHPGPGANAQWAPGNLRPKTLNIRLTLQVIAATNRADILDPALMRSGRLDRKIEFPHPTEDARAKILQIHSRKMNVSPDVNFEELARSTDDFNAAQLKAVCVEAGMLALRRDATEARPDFALTIEV